MKINFVYEMHTGDWSKRYVSAVFDALDGTSIHALNVTDHSTFETASRIRRSPRCDLWYVFSIFDKWLSPVMDRARMNNEHVIVHNHCGRETGDYEALLWANSDTTVFPTVCSDMGVTVLFNTESNLRDFEKLYGEVNSRIVGFPVTIGETYKLKRRGIVVPGRLTPGKQPMLAMRILEPFKKQVTFCTGKSIRDTAGEALRNAGFKVVQVVESQYFSLLQRSKVGFSCTMADSLNSSVVEMAMCGVRLVVPDIPTFDYLPQMVKYEPYHVMEAQVLLEKALGHFSSWPTPTLQQFSRESFIRNVRKVLNL